MSYDKLEKIINESFEKKEKVSSKSDKKLVKALTNFLSDFELTFSFFSKLSFIIFSSLS